MTLTRKILIASALGAVFGATAALIWGPDYWWLGAIPALIFGMAIGAGR